MMMKTINNIFSWGISSGFFVALVWFLWGYVRPLLEAKKQHAKTVQQREALDMLLKFADTAVASLTSRTDLAGHDKFKLATQQVRETMEAKGLSVTEGMIQDAVQAAYEKSLLTPGQSVDPVKEAIKSAPNRADKLLVTDGSITQAKG